MTNKWFCTVFVRTVVVFVVIFSYVDSVLSFRGRELRARSWCPEVGLDLLCWFTFDRFDFDLGVRRLV